ncbi:Rdx family protein [Erwinia amylovora]|uniref:Selenoprotein W-related protein n=3 Tax=Erwinia amylovora TaxID=552 RepID=A0A831A3L2_ERWAM|nr:SelT/SelW/SelH family protein [Erwinia amylovora]CDK15249.1 selenoprotein W-related protein [Erwinia amylovora LA635]CDK18615.1 selenoprotein W-related protein [Erwinia amylovora LA636]CDK21985.1 selenoprotein W-related protein [Erwinia amylovora LA637]ATZ11556.1 selenoprotein W-related protein [Erwinia amylovora]EKV54465.1 selenoprotein W-related protein [Erwinia amylovora ACW56400]
MTTLPLVTIHYCSQCNWMLRASWLAQELLHTFSTDLGAVTLIPTTGGVYKISVNQQVIWDRKNDNGFPDAAEIKRRVRAVCFPQRDLGHIDRHAD